MMGVKTRNMYNRLQKCNKLNKSHLVGQLLNSMLLLVASFIFLGEIFNKDSRRMFSVLHSAIIHILSRNPNY